MKVIIVGGVAGGASCAARLRRLDEQIDILSNGKRKGPDRDVREETSMRTSTTLGVPAGTPNAMMAH
jgi:hypothetical protein